MKNLSNISIFISVLFAFLMSGCDQKAEVVILHPLDDVKIVYRSCPNGGDCACYIAFKNPSSNDEVTVTICGTTDGNAASCSEPDPPVTCEVIDGLAHSGITLNDDYPRHQFCMETEHGIRIDAVPMNGPDTLIISCQDGVLNADTTMIIIHYPATRVYIRTTAECEVPRCI